MQSELHQASYDQLFDVTARLKQAVSSGDYEALPGLTTEHNMVMETLRRLGLSDNPDLLELVLDVKRQVDEAMNLMRNSRDQLSEALTSTAGKRKQVAAYRTVEDCSGPLF